MNPDPASGGPVTTEMVARAARELGLDRVGVVSDPTTEHAPFLEWWIDRGFHGEMAYLARPESLARRRDLRETLREFSSAIVVAQEYGTEVPGPESHDDSRAVIARYARGRDYHEVLLSRLEALRDWLAEAADVDVSSRVYVDTGPLLERDLAQRAGLGWFGRNTMLIHPKAGSYAFIGVLLTDLPLQPTGAFGDDRCGTCTRCLDACPTGALLGRTDSGAPVMDARRCISYLTIELRGPIPVEFRAAIGNRVFGCDICQEVCPFNQRFSRPSGTPEYGALDELKDVTMVDLAERLLAMSGKEVQRVFAGSPLSRPGRKGLLRNLCVGLGNWGATSETAGRQAGRVLTKAADDRSELVQEHARWGLEQLRS